MARVRLGVALLVPPPFDREIDGLRRACGDGALLRVRPHLTLVPPVNVRVDALPDALRLVRESAAASPPLTLRLGPPATFLPDNPTVYLGVGGADESLSALHGLRERVARPPLDRPRAWPFVPHVTLADDMAVDRIPKALDALADYRIAIEVDRVYVLQEQRHGESHRGWVPVADYPFEPAAVVGRGGLPLELTVSRLADPEVRRFETGEWPADDPGPLAEAPTPVGTEPVVVTARRRGELVGLARGWTGGGRHELTAVLVAPEVRGQGIARHLTSWFRLAVDRLDAATDGS